MDDVGATARCLGCNYLLQGLDNARCPECGRAFDPSDATTFNTGRPLTWLDRTLLAPIGWPMFVVAAVLCIALLVLSLGTGIYYLGIYCVISAIVFGALAMRLGLRNCVPPPNVTRPQDKKRVMGLLAIPVVTFAFVIGQVPLRIVFWMARPDLDRLVADIQSGRVARPIGPRRAGPLTITQSNLYGGDDTLFFEYTVLGQSGGLAYCPTNGPGGYYNTGADGPLGGHWYWWVDD